MKCSILKNCRFKHWHRSFSYEQSKNSNERKIVFNQPPLTEQFPNLPDVIYASSKSVDQGTRITALNNGLRVASEDRYGQFCTVGVVINAGSRFETGYLSGISHFLKKLAYVSTSKYKSKGDLQNELFDYGGVCDCLPLRDVMVYAVSVERNGVDKAIEVLSEAILRPLLTDDEVLNVQRVIEYELENWNDNIEQKMFIADMIHKAAFGKDSLGLPLICPPSSLFKINRSILFQYLKHHYVPSNMVVAGVGVEHERLLECVQKHFVEKTPIWIDEDLACVKQEHGGRNCGSNIYKGGIVTDECKMPKTDKDVNTPELTHLALGIQGVSYNNEDFITTCILQAIMGGGLSFSSAGPGRRIYARLYANIIRRYRWFFNATAYNCSYDDAGLFFIHASVPPEYVGPATEVLVKEIIRMNQPVHSDELKRAKKQIQSLTLMTLESSPAIFEDIGRQVLATGRRIKPKEFIDLVDNVTTTDIFRLTQKITLSNPSVAARGNIKYLPNFEDIQAGMLDSRGVVLRRSLKNSK